MDIIACYLERVLLLIKANEYWSGIIAISMMIVAILVLAGFIENRIRG